MLNRHNWAKLKLKKNDQVEIQILGELGALIVVHKIIIYIFLYTVLLSIRISMFLITNI